MKLLEFKEKVNTVICGDALSVLRTFPDECISMCVTSPPYYSLRDYGVEGQMGLEDTPEIFIEKMVEVFREVKRVLKPEGTFWLNIGDSYSSHKDCKSTPQSLAKGRQSEAACVLSKGKSSNRNTKMLKSQGLKNKDLIGIPWMLAFALRADGWYLRQDIIWAKPNPMPESCTDRCTKAHEYIFLLTKRANYYYDADAIRELADTKPHKMGGKQTSSDRNDGDRQDIVIGNGFRNKRSVFDCPTQFSKMRDDLSIEKKEKLVAELIKRGII